MIISYSTSIWSKGKKIAVATERIAVAPGDDLGIIKEDDYRAVAEAIHTPAAVEKYRAEQAAEIARQAEQSAEDVGQVGAAGENLQ